MTLKERLETKLKKVTVDKIYKKLEDTLSELALAGEKGCFFDLDFDNKPIEIEILKKLKEEELLEVTPHPWGIKYKRVLVWDETAIKNIPLTSLNYIESPCSGCTIVSEQMEQCSKCQYKLNGITKYLLTKKIVVTLEDDVKVVDEESPERVWALCNGVKNL